MVGSCFAPWKEIVKNESCKHFTHLDKLVECDVAVALDVHEGEDLVRSLLRSGLVLGHLDRRTDLHIIIITFINIIIIIISIIIIII